MRIAVLVFAGFVTLWLGCAESPDPAPFWEDASAPTCDDGERNGNETDVDCGGACPGCELDRHCQTADDCQAALGCGPLRTCVPHCVDGWTDRDETDTDCGGNLCAGCESNRACRTSDDCLPELGCGTGLYCLDHCIDRILDRDETDVDCGGARCAPCALDQGCVTSDDCGPALGCNSVGTCVVHCADDVADRGETDIDCGGTCPYLCGIGQGCAADADCDLGLVCIPSGRCDEPCANGVLDLGESDVDCGGGCAPCPSGGSCILDDDCLSHSCNGTCDTVNPLDATELCFLLTAADLNQDLTRTCTQAPIPGAFAYDPPEALAYQCRPGTWGFRWGERLLGAAEAGRVDLDVGLARDCLARSRALRLATPGFRLRTLPEWQALGTGVCADFHLGAVAAGESCVDDWDCAAGLGCHSDTPTVAESKRCSPKAALGEPCGVEYHPCGAGLYCDALSDLDGTCRELVADGQPCNEDLECQSGRCATETQTCFVRRGLGETCTTSAECAATACAVCRPRQAEGTPTCELAGGEGEYCRTWDDCAADLGCTGHRCAALPAGATCGPHECSSRILEGTCTDDPRCEWVVQMGVGFCVSSDQHLCRPGLHCLSELNCIASSESECLAKPACIWLSDKLLGAAFCTDALGYCVRLPQSGPCFGTTLGPGTGCADGFFCNALGECAPLGRDGAACRDDADCDSRLAFGCLEETCVRFCQIPEDCQPGQYCDSRASPPACEPYASTTCVDSAQCPPEQYCALPAGACAVYPSEPSCSSDPLCAWSTACAPADTGATGSCLADLPTGAIAYPNPYFSGRLSGDSAMCESGYAVRTAPDEFRCAVAPTAPANSCGGFDRTNAAFLQLVFLFGGVIVRSRRRGAPD